MTDTTDSDVAEIAPDAFEGELRDGADVVVLDTRDPEAFAAWRVDVGRGALLNVSEAELAVEPGRTLTLVREGVPLRVICNSGSQSRRVAALLARHGVEALSVRDGMIGWSRVLQRDEIAVTCPFTVVQFRREARGCLSYLVAAGGEALVVDPAPGVEPYLEEAAAHGVRIVRVFDTHVHADHVSGARELAARTGAVLHLSTPALARGLRYAAEVSPVGDGETFDVGGEKVTVLALPGHTSDMTGLLLGEAALIGGDSLFLDSVARPDLEAGDEGAEAAARELWRTLRDRVVPLPDSTLLLPCHYAGGRCDGPVVARLGEVRREVGELSLDEGAFAARILGQMPPRPANFLSIIGVNLGEEPVDDAAARLEVGANNCAAKVEWAQASA